MTSTRDQHARSIQLADLTGMSDDESDMPIDETGGNETGGNRGTDETQGLRETRPGAEPDGPEPQRNSPEGNSIEENATEENGSGKEQPEDVGPVGEGDNPERKPEWKTRNWPAFSFQQEKLKHLTTVGLVLSGGIITLLQTEMMNPTPLRVVALVPAVFSSMLTLAAQVSLGNEASSGAGKSRDAFGVPVSIHWFQLAALVLLSLSIGWLASFFFIDIGLLP